MASKRAKAGVAAGIAMAVTTLAAPSEGYYGYVYKDPKRQGQSGCGSGRRFANAAGHRRREAMEAHEPGALGMIGIIGMALGVSFVDTLKRIGFCLSANSPASRG